MNGKILKFERREIPPPPEDFDTSNALKVCEEMLGLVLKTTHPTQAAAYTTHMLIHFHDLAQRAKTIGHRLTFSDDVDLRDDVTDITDLISKLRNAVCHIRSPSRKLGEGGFVFNRFSGYIPQAVSMNGEIAGCNYPDDMAVYYGPYRFYVHRHGYRALAELRSIFAPSRR